MSDKTLFIAIDGEFKQLLDKANLARNILLEALDMEASDYEGLTHNPHAMVFAAIRAATANVEQDLANLGLYVLKAVDEAKKAEL